MTRADLAAHDLFVARLGGLVPDIRIVSEESLAPRHTERRTWRRFWLIEDRRPVMGVVTGPALTVTYFAASGLGAFKRARGGSGQAHPSQGASPSIPPGSPGSPSGSGKPIFPRL